MSHPITSSPLFPLPGEREEGGRGVGVRGVFSCFGESRSDTIDYLEVASPSGKIRSPLRTQTAPLSIPLVPFRSLLYGQYIMKIASR